MRLIFQTLFGSHIYGTNLPSSDHDFKSVFIPEARDILLGMKQEVITTSTKKISTDRNEPGDIDTESFSMKRYAELLLQGQTVALDMLFTPSSFWDGHSIPWETIRENRRLFLHRGVSSFAGYCRQQANKYGIKGSRIAELRQFLQFLDDTFAGEKPTAPLRTHWDKLWDFVSGWEHMGHDERIDSNGHVIPHLTVCNRLMPPAVSYKDARAVYQKVLDEYGHRAKLAESNQGIDWKALMHAVRVCGEAEELLLTHQITFPRPEAPLLLSIRQGYLSYYAVAEMIEQGLESLEKAKAASTLPDTPDTESAMSLVAQAYAEEVRRVYQK